MGWTGILPDCGAAAGCSRPNPVNDPRSLPPGNESVLDMIDYYNLLGVTPDATPAEIKSAFRTQAKKAHPDAHPGLAPKQREALQRRFIALAKAYETLGDPEKRERYRRQWRAHRRAAQARSGPFRETRAGFGAARRASRQGPAGAPPAGEPSESMEDLFGDVEELLAGFGLSLRQPFEELLDALMNWAKGVFQQVMQAWDEDHAAGKTTGKTTEKPTGKPPGQDASGPKGKDRTGKSRGRAEDPEADIEAELKSLKARARTQGSRAKRAESETEAELRRLKKRMGKGD